MRDYREAYKRKLKDCLYWMQRAKRAEKALEELRMKLATVLDESVDDRTDAQRIMGYPAISNMPADFAKALTKCGMVGYDKA